MKKLRKGWMLCLMAVLAAFCFALGACGESAGNTVTFTFQTNGGAPIDPVEVETGTEYTLPTPEARADYAFEGWYLAEDFSGSPCTRVTAEQDTTFYAKWLQGYLVTLDPGEGTLPGATSLRVQAGELLQTALAAYTPAAKTGYEFGAWFLGENEVSPSTKMPAENITLTARYKVGYTVELYERKSKEAEFERVDTQTGYAYADGKTFTPPIESRTGATEVNTPDTVKSKVLDGANPQANVFKIYYDRTESNIYFNSNYPKGSGMEDDEFEKSGYYGDEIELPFSEFSLPGYFLIGWCEEKSGEGEIYYTNALGANLVNGTPTEPGTYTVGGDTVLYAVWQAGYTDMFGGNDILVSAESELKDGGAIYLIRSGYTFRGELEISRRGTVGFYFYEDADGNNTGDPMLEGRIIDDKFCYLHDSSTFALYENGTLNDSVKLILGQYNDVTYTGAADGNKTGTYTFNEMGDLQITFTDGTQMVVMLAIYTDENEDEHAAFRIRNEAEVALGTLVRCEVYNGSLVSYSSISAGLYEVTLDGFGYALYNDGSSIGYIYYAVQDDILLLASGSSSYSTFKIIDAPNGNGKGYILYEQDLDLSFTGTSEMNKLTLDGACNATLTENGVTLNGYYEAESSIIGGMLVRVYLQGNTRRFMLSATQEDEDYSYHYSEVPQDYGEYYYLGEGNVVGAPLLVLNDVMGEAKTFTLYGLFMNTYIVKIAEGTLQFSDETGRYLATVTNTVKDVEGIVDTLPFDIFNMTAFTFSVQTVLVTTQSNGVVAIDGAYWWSVTANGETTNCEKEYTEKNAADDAGKLTLVGGFAIYQKGDTTISGVAAEMEDFLVVRYMLSETQYTTAYFLIEGQEFTLISPFLYGSVYYVNEENLIDRTVSLQFDGKGGATYTEGETVKQGTATAVRAADGTPTYTDFGNYIYKFQSADQTVEFDFICIAGSSATYFAKYREAYAGDFSTTDGFLMLDGYMYGSYQRGEGTFEGMFYKAEENVLCFYDTTNNYVFYFEIGNGTFSELGGEYGEYLICDNNAIRQTLLKLDGKNGATLYVTDDDSEGEIEVVGTGSYVFGEDGGITVTYTPTGTSQTVTLVGTLALLTISDSRYPTLIISYEEVVATYLNPKDWSTLVLDNLGNAVRNSATGGVETGTYTIITETLLYYVNTDGSFACVYRYDPAKGTATPVELQAKTYYSENFEALRFTTYGYMISNGSTRYFYYQEENGNVTLYLHDPDAGNCNPYGFVQIDSFGSFNQQVNFEGKDYYLSDGTGLHFTRSEESTKYPIKLSDGGAYNLEDFLFYPSGAETFVSTVVLVMRNGSAASNFTAALVRIVEDDVTEAYLLLQADYNVYLQFMIDLHLEIAAGKFTCTYTITGMNMIEEYNAYAYAYLYAYVTQYYGSSYAQSLENTFGSITLTTPYTVSGDADSEHMKFEAHFGPDMGLTDSTGKTIGTIEAGREDIELSSSGIVVNFTGADGKPYVLDFTVQSLSDLGLYGAGFYCYTFSRVYTLEQDGYTVRVQRVLYTEANGVTVGSLLMPEIGVGTGEEIEWITARFAFDDETGGYYVGTYTTGDTGLIESATWYFVNFGYNEDGDEVTLQKFEVKKATTVYYTDLVSFFQYIETDDGGREVMVFRYGNYFFHPDTCSYDAESETYTLSVQGVVFTIQVGEDGKATLTVNS